MSPRTAILLSALAALLAKLACAALTRGTNDVDDFYNFGRFIGEHGLLAQYRATPEFNHTPAVGWYCALLYGLGRGLGFPFLLRLPGIVADLAVVLLLLRPCKKFSSPPPWALALLALSPVSFIISGFHGNVDSVLVALLVMAALQCGMGRAAWCGLWFGLACNVKIIPLFVAPVFFFHFQHRGNARRFFTVASLTILAGWAVPLVALPEIFLRDVLGYSSNWGGWGIPYWLSQTHLSTFAPAGFDGLTPAQLAIMAALKVVIVSAVLWIAWQRRALAAAHLFSTLALVWTVFFVCAPGVGAQYLVWIAPFLLIHAPRWYAAVTAASTVFLFVFYNTICGGLPWNHGASTAGLLPHWGPWSNAPWLTFVAMLLLGWRVRSNRAGYSPASSSSS